MTTAVNFRSKNKETLTLRMHWLGGGGGGGGDWYPPPPSQSSLIPVCSLSLALLRIFRMVRLAGDALVEPEPFLACSDDPFLLLLACSDLLLTCSDHLLFFKSSPLECSDLQVFFPGILWFSCC